MIGLNAAGPAVRDLAVVRPFARRVIVLGSGTLARRIICRISTMPARYNLLGSVPGEVSSDAAPPGVALLGTLGQLDRIIKETRPDVVIVALEERRRNLPLRALLEARAVGIAIEDGASALERLSGTLPIESLPPGALIFSPGFHRSRLDLALSRILSLLGALAGLVVASPMFALIAVLIALESRGGVLFVQERAGLHGKPFRLMKFRTMRAARQRPASEWAADNGHRITLVGRWLRAFRLDELPQLVNVLRGDMNLVGPRPHPCSNIDLFMRKIPYYWIRMTVRPGLTGWAQIRYGYANNLEQETEKMRYDLYYIKRRSVWMDIRILAETVRIVLLGRGAAAPVEPLRATPAPFRARRRVAPRSPGAIAPSPGLIQPVLADRRSGHPDPPAA
jgi:exopolysaccharide biosynthesis polyprenyl glycosylphosphotransferase